MRLVRGLLSIALVAALGREAHADGGPGYQLNRFEPTPAGDVFFGVEHPWYSSTRYFAGGLTFDYNHNLLVKGAFDANGNFVRSASLIEHQLVGHVDLAVSFLDRVAITATLPLTLFEAGGTPVTAGGVTVGPISSAVAVGDPRFGIRVRLAGQHDDGPAAISLGANIWAPIGANGNHAGDSFLRAQGRLMAGGLVADIFRWSINLGYLYRQTAALLPAAPTANEVGMEVQGGVGLALVLAHKTFSIGPEAIIAFGVASGLPSRESLTNLEVLGTINYFIAEQVLLMAGAGGGVVGEPGPPDVRALFRIAYAPRRPKEKPAPPPDRDHDGILDLDDACPDEPGVASNDPKKHGCPLPKDRDKDGVLDVNDICPDEPMGKHPDPQKLGCPAKDTDGDGLYDYEDKCPNESSGMHPDKTRPGCPDKDTDGDEIYDSEDQCPNEKPGMNPDPKRPGCPAPDRDADSVPDAVDACPDTPGAPDPDPKKNGCPGKVILKNQQIVILDQVYFATAKDVVLEKSFPVLDAVAYTMKTQTGIKKLSVEGHTDNKGKPERNKDLSQRRANSVMKYLTGKGIEAARLEAHGYGQERPIDDNKTSKGRANNRRVEFHITDPAPEPSATPTPTPTPPPAPAK